MPMIHLMRQDTPARPVTINTDHVASLRPLRRLVPSSVSQTPGHVVAQYMGTELVLVNGERINVCEQYTDVLQLISGLPPVAEVDTSTAKADLVAGVLNPSQIPNLRDEKADQEFVSQLKEAGVPVSDKEVAENISDYGQTEQVAEQIIEPHATVEVDGVDQGPGTQAKTAKKAPAKKATAKAEDKSDAESVV